MLILDTRPAVSRKASLASSAASLTSAGVARSSASRSATSTACRLRASVICSHNWRHEKQPNRRSFRRPSLRRAAPSREATKRAIFITATLFSHCCSVIAGPLSRTRPSRRPGSPDRTTRRGGGALGCWVIVSRSSFDTGPGKRAFRTIRRCFMESSRCFRSAACSTHSLTIPDSVMFHSFGFWFHAVERFATSWPPRRVFPAAPRTFMCQTIPPG